MRISPAPINRSPFAEGRPGSEKTQTPRPGGIGLIAGFQLVKGTIFLLTALVLRWNPNDVLSPQSIFYPVLYVATRGNYVLLHAAIQSSNLLPGILFLLGSYLLASGLGLWQIQRWARQAVIISSILTLALWAKATFLSTSSGFAISSYGTTSPDLQNFYILLFFDLLVFTYLIRNSIAQLFNIKLTR